ncbi:protein SIEVE ELEMENT OCCLUSION B-like isoform X2 [Andrographis paniculata]|uniref:protein SIEVE ELEMENT OCCLUSION B-like isoform X2 n=1 Tax=Andrographis paniculata TaxID=175694 RepID=UPI0021E7FEE3|nr:protein SIEVE ELEMENT OCCLUSION B-like isoform X2 [Andrographis paniculata]
MMTSQDGQFISADESALTSQILARHAFDGKETFNVKLIISVVKHIISITRKSNSIISKCVDGGGHFVTMSLLESLSKYSWSAKVVIALAAFTINYGEICLVEHLNTEYQLAKGLTDLMDFSQVTTEGNKLYNKLLMITELLSELVIAADCIIEVEELSTKYHAQKVTRLKDTAPQAAYWIISSLLTCASALLDPFGSMPSSDKEILTAVAPNMESLGQFKNELSICRELIERDEAREAYRKVQERMLSPCVVNLDILQVLIRSKEDRPSLYDGSKKTNAHLNELKFKNVMLLISELELPPEQLNFLRKIFDQTNRMAIEFKIVWLPIVQKNMSLADEQGFKELRDQMPWYSVDHPSLIDQAVISYIRELWNFENTAKVVVLNPQGKILNLNALPMLWIWGTKAFPLTIDREKVLWAESNQWSLELLVDSLHPRIPEWIKDNKVVCIYGGEDIDQIREFTAATKTTAQELQVPIEMLFVGKLNEGRRGNVRYLYHLVSREMLSHIFPPEECYDYIWYFWERLRSMWQYRKKISVEGDEILQHLNDMLSFKDSETGWAVFSRGNNETAKGNVMKLLSIFDKREELKRKVDRQPENFVRVLDEMVRATEAEHCNRLIMLVNDNMPDRFVCADCGKDMETYYMFRCCND